MADDERSRMRKSSLGRTARLAALPAAYAGRTALGVGKRIGGKPAEAVLSEVQRRTADQLFTVLGELKGGAMKLGQALSIFESALPEEIAGPYREVLTKLQDAAPPMTIRMLDEVLSEELGAGWREEFASFDDRPAAAASLGQVHKAVWADGTPVAVKVQYPGAAKALASDLRTLSRVARLIGLIAPGVDIKPLLEEIADRAVEELDYELEASAQRVFAAEFEGDASVTVPAVVHASKRVLITTWLDSPHSLAHVIKDGTPEERQRVGEQYARFLISGPARTGLLHADPHPGNFRVMTDGRLGVVDFGAAARLPDGLPAPLGGLLRLAADDDWDGVADEMRAQGWLLPHTRFESSALRDYLRPLLAPARERTFAFSRDWLRGEATRVAIPTPENLSRAFKINLPPEYMLIHRVWMGGIGVLCQLEVEIGFRGLLEEHAPGFA
ncbi:ABC1 kinase family protein [Nocardioides phosphati]|nr:AarF/ABC1/UbiB kinase family protein [Nocardioides phosphati]